MGIIQDRRNRAGFGDTDISGKYIMVVKPEDWKGWDTDRENSSKERALGRKAGLSGAEQRFFWEEGEESGCFSLESERKRETIRKNNNPQTENDWQELEKIAVRAAEILSEWKDTEDVRMQVQYGALVIGKIENLKKKESISSDGIKKKICTLLKNTIRLNISERRFSKEQIQLLQDGFSLLLAEHVQKEDMLQLNRELRNEGLQTMPAWE